MNDREYMGQCARLSCAICRRLGLCSWPVELHHPRTGTGGAAKASNWDVIPLCVRHHRHAEGIHHLGTKAWLRTFKVTEYDLVWETRWRCALMWSLDVNRWATAFPPELLQEPGGW